jgi:hypothetical protein
MYRKDGLMSVQQNHYVVIGKRFDYKEFYTLVCPNGDADHYFDTEHPYTDSAFKGIHHHNDICIISDGMNGKYVVVGRVLQKSGNYGALDDFKDDRRKPSAAKVSEWIKRELGIDVKCSMISFTHYR